MNATIPLNHPADQVLHDPDAIAVLEQLASGLPLDPAVVERVRARATQITDGIRRSRGLVDDDTFQALLDDES